MAAVLETLSPELNQLDREMQNADGETEKHKNLQIFKYI